MALIRDEALVIRSYKLGEADRIVLLFTKGHGKLRAIAKGSRKTKSRIGGRVEPLSHLNVQLWMGKDLHILSQAETIDSNFELRIDLPSIQRAMSILEIVDKLTHDDYPDPTLFDATIRAVRSLANNKSVMYVPAFFLRALQIEGFGPNLDTCRLCGTNDDIVAFDPRSAAVTCSQHPIGSEITPGALRAMRLVLQGQASRAFVVTKREDEFVMEGLVVSFCEAMIERKLKTISPLLRH